MKANIGILEWKSHFIEPQCTYIKMHASEIHSSLNLHSPVKADGPRDRNHQHSTILSLLLGVPTHRSLGQTYFVLYVIKIMTNSKRYFGETSTQLYVVLMSVLPNTFHYLDIFYLANPLLVISELFSAQDYGKTNASVSIIIIFR